MIISIILAHPSPASYNHAIAQMAARTLRQAGHTVRLHDLYAEGFDPLLPCGEEGRDAELPPQVAAHCVELAEAEGLVFVHPNWWGQPPAILTGWVDRVVRPGVAYRFIEGDAGDGVPEGLLRAHTALVFNTANTPAAREEQVFGDPLERIWRDCILGLCGVHDIRRTIYRVIVTSTLAQRAAWLQDVASQVLAAFSPDAMGSMS